MPSKKGAPPTLAERLARSKKQAEEGAKVSTAPTPTREQVTKILTPTAHEVTVDQEGRFSFADAATQLKAEGFDLEGERAKAVELHRQVGIVGALQAKGIVQNADQYGALFDEVRFDDEVILKLAGMLNNLKRGAQRLCESDCNKTPEDTPEDIFEQYMRSYLLPVFNSGHLSLQELWGLLECEPNNLFTRIDLKGGFDIKKIAPKNLDLAKLTRLLRDYKEVEKWGALRNQTRDSLKEFFRAAHSEAPELSQSGPQCLLTLPVADIHFTGHNRVGFDEYMEKVAAGEVDEPIDPASDLIRLMTQHARRTEIHQRSSLDPYTTNKIYFDRDKILCYPLYFTPQGVLCFTDYREFGHSLYAIPYVPPYSMPEFDYVSRSVQFTKKA